MDTLKWMFSLYDGMSGPAASITKGLGGIQSALDGLPGATAVAQQGFQMLIAGAMKLGSIVFEGGSFAVNALAFKESTIASFELMLGTKQAAKDIFDQAKSFGKLTPFETEDVIKSFKDLLQAGFTKKEVPIVFQAVGDVAAGNNFDKSIMDRLTLVLGQIRGNGKINGGDFIQLNNAGVGRSPVYDAISKIMNVKPSEVSKLVEHGKVTADIAIAGVMDAIKAKYSGGKDLGSGQLAQATTLKGLFSTLSSAPMDMFLDIDLDKSKGFQGLKSFVGNLTAALNPDSATGSKLKSIIESVVNDVGGLLGTISMDDLTNGFSAFVDIVKVGIDGIVGFKDGVMAVLQPTLDLFATMEGGQDKSAGFVDAMTVLGYVLGGILNVLLLVGMAIGTALEGFKLIGDIDFSYMLEQMKDFGADLLKGLAEGIMGAISWPVDAIMASGRATIEAFKHILDIHSPSGVFEEFGGFTAEGFANGLTGGRGMVDSAVNGMVSVPKGGAGGLGGSPTINLSVHVEGSGADAETLARKLAELLPSQLASAFEQMAIEGGTA